MSATVHSIIRRVGLWSRIAIHLGKRFNCFYAAPSPNQTGTVIGQVIAKDGVLDERRQGGMQIIGGIPPGLAGESFLFSDVAYMEMARLMRFIRVSMSNPRV